VKILLQHDHLLKIASENGDIRIINYLLQYGANMQKSPWRGFHKGLN
jgi:hypothetical protein